MIKKKLLKIAPLLLILPSLGCFIKDDSDIVVVKPDDPHAYYNTDSNTNQTEDDIKGEEEYSDDYNINGDTDEYPDTIPVDEDLPVLNDGSGSGYFTTVDLDGNTYDQSIFAESDYTLLNIWGTFCGPCINELPDLGRLATSYSNVQVVGVVCDVYEGDSQGIAYAQDIVDETGAYYTHLLANSDMENWKLGEIEYVPTTYIIDSEGNIIYETVGSHSYDEWATIISENVEFE